MDALPFDNSALRSLPRDPAPVALAASRRSVPFSCFSLASPAPLANPRLVAASGPALRVLGLSERAVATPRATAQLAGSAPVPGAVWTANCYCGHQFGSFSGQLGDGAAMTMGEILVPAPRDGAAGAHSQAAGDCGKDATATKDPLAAVFAPALPQEPRIHREAAAPALVGSGAGLARWELQLKGAGPTPYSRDADGRKVLRSSLREFLASEAMHFLGVPTTRAAALVVSAEGAEPMTAAYRDAQYSGNVVAEPCAVLTRFAQSFIRFGSFELAKPKDALTGRAGPSADGTPVRPASEPGALEPGALDAPQSSAAQRQHALVQRLAARDGGSVVVTLLNYLLRHHFPHLAAPVGDGSDSAVAGSLGAFEATVSAVLATGAGVIDSGGSGGDAAAAAADAAAAAELAALVAKALAPLPASDAVPAASNGVSDALLAVTADPDTLVAFNLAADLTGDLASDGATATARGAASAVTVGSLRRAYLAWLLEVTARTAALVAQWQKVGFTHGVLNTDNMSALGVTLDYGPYGWQDAFNMNHTPNGSDHEGRYDWKGQSEICQWNCEKLAETFAITPFPVTLLSDSARALLSAAPAPAAAPAVTGDDDEDGAGAAAAATPVAPATAAAPATPASAAAAVSAGPILDASAAAVVAWVFQKAYRRAFLDVWRGKLGLATATGPANADGNSDAGAGASAVSASASGAFTCSCDEERATQSLANSLWYTMHETCVDFTLALRALGGVVSDAHRALLRQAEAEAETEAGTADVAGAGASMTPAAVSAALAAAEFAAPAPVVADNADAGAGAGASCSLRKDASAPSSSLSAAVAVEPAAGTAAATAPSALAPAADADLAALARLCADAAHYNARRDRLRPEDSEAYLHSRLQEFDQLVRKHPKFRTALHGHGAAARRALAAWGEYNRTEDLTGPEKRERDAELWAAWLESYRERLAKDEAALATALLAGPAAAADAVRALPGAAAQASAAFLADSADNRRLVAAYLKLRSRSPVYALALAPLLASNAAAVEAAADVLPASAPAAVAARQLLRAIAFARGRSQRGHNPAFTLRTWAAQEAIEAAERGDFLSVHALAFVLEDPYDILAAAWAAEAGDEVAAMKRDAEAQRTWLAHTDFTAFYSSTANGSGDGQSAPAWDAARFSERVSEWRRKLAQLPPAEAADICVTCSS